MFYKKQVKQFMMSKEVNIRIFVRYRSEYSNTKKAVFGLVLVYTDKYKC